MPNISFERIGTPTPTGSSITVVQAMYPSGIGHEVVTEVPAGERFEIWARGVAVNPNALSWETLFTAKSGDALDDIAQFDTTDVYGSPADTGLVELKFNKNGERINPIMPNRDLSIRIKLWGNDHRGMAIPSPGEW